HRASAATRSRSLPKCCARTSRAIWSTTSRTTSSSGWARRRRRIAAHRGRTSRVELHLDKLLALHCLPGEDGWPVAHLRERFERRFLKHAAHRMGMDDVDGDD